MIRRSLPSLFVFLLLISLSCTKETTKISAAETNAKLLAGTTSGSDKSWSLISITDTGGGSTYLYNSTSSNTGIIPGCELDNVFIFSNNANQRYSQSEGGSVCHSGDSTTVEKGSWAFSDDGKTLIVQAQYYITSTQYNDTNGDEPFIDFMILGLNGPLTVSSISASSLSLSYNFTYQSVTYSTTLSFISK